MLGTESHSATAATVRMTGLSPNILSLIALFCGGWFAIAAWATMSGVHGRRKAMSSLVELQRAQALAMSSPAAAVVVLPGGAIEIAGNAYLRLGLLEPPGDVADLQAHFEEQGGTNLGTQVAETAAAGATSSHRSGRPARPGRHPAGSHR